MYLKTIIITAQNAVFIKNAINSIPEMAGMFTAPYSQLDTNVPTHYVSEGATDENFALALTNEDLLIDFFNSINITITAQYAQKLISETIVSDNPASEELSKLNLVPTVYENV